MAFKFTYTKPVTNYTWLPQETLDNTAISVTTSGVYGSGSDLNGNSKTGLKLNSDGYFEVTINQETKIILYILVRSTKSTTTNISINNNETYEVTTMVPLELTLDSGTYKFTKPSGAEGLLYQVDFELL